MSDASGAAEGAPVTERIRRARNTLAPAEVRVVETLMADYPMAGLSSVARLAEAAAVSAPTVLRLLAKLGFSGYPEFREQLRSEVAVRLFSPVETYPGVAARPDSGPAAPLGTAEGAFAEAVRQTFRGVDAGEFDRAVTALADPTRAVLVAGGRFSTTTAAHLAAYLEILRPGVTGVVPEPGQRARALLSVDRQTTLVVFDFRRYQPDTTDFALQAQARGAQVVLVCDPFLSPLAPLADVLLTVSVAGPPPFDSAVGGLMLAETLIGAVAERLGAPARERLADFEEHANGADAETMARLRQAVDGPAEP
jgi:DNA-binding MurR/RpiR family transcriptional regulator